MFIIKKTRTKTRRKVLLGLGYLHNHAQLYTVSRIFFYITYCYLLLRIVVTDGEAQERLNLKCITSTGPQNKTRQFVGVLVIFKFFWGKGLKPCYHQLSFHSLHQTQFFTLMLNLMKISEKLIIFEMQRYVYFFPFC